MTHGDLCSCVRHHNGIDCNQQPTSPAPRQTQLDSILQQRLGDIVLLVHGLFNPKCVCRTCKPRTKIAPSHARHSRRPILFQRGKIEAGKPFTQRCEQMQYVAIY